MPQKTRSLADAQRLVNLLWGFPVFAVIIIIWLLNSDKLGSLAQFDITDDIMGTTLPYAFSAASATWIAVFYFAQKKDLPAVSRRLFVGVLTILAIASTLALLFLSFANTEFHKAKCREQGGVPTTRFTGPVVGWETTCTAHGVLINI